MIILIGERLLQGQVEGRRLVDCSLQFILKQTDRRAKPNQSLVKSNFYRHVAEAL